MIHLTCHYLIWYLYILRDGRRVLATLLHVLFNKADLIIFLSQKTFFSLMEYTKIILDIIELITVIVFSWYLYILRDGRRVLATLLSHDSFHWSLFNLVPLYSKDVRSTSYFIIT
jgi:hypothetical protein